MTAATSEQKQQVHFNPLFTEAVEKRLLPTLFLDSEYPKLAQAMEVHGYRGASRKKHNGVVPIRPSDSGLVRALRKQTQAYALSTHKTKALDEIIAKGTPIKVVAHVPTGNRLVGYMWNNQILITGVANYND